jgi:glycosyltransferase involved in cell wall biosynthesis
VANADVKVIHVPFSFPPDPMGGTEVYVEALAHLQRRDGLTAIVAAPARHETSYWHRDIWVRRFAVAESVTDIRELYGDGDKLAAEGFAKILAAEGADLVHLHAFTRAVSLRLVREAKRRHRPVVFTYHTPTSSCQRGTLLRWGSEICDGNLDVKTCSGCTLHGAGVNRHVSQVIAALPQNVSRMIAAAGLSGGIWTALRMPDLIAQRHTAFHALVSEVDHIVALGGWSRSVLLRNGVPAAKITASRQGLCHPPSNMAALPTRKVRAAASPVRVMCVGRFDATKGVHVLLEAVRAAPNLTVEVDIYGVVQTDAGAAYLQRLQHIADGDRRITFRGAIPEQGVVARMREYDAVVVASQSLETGPMVVMEAFAAGVPVVGSNLGGIAELVTDGVDGLLVEPRSVDSWTRALERLCHDASLLAALRNGIRPPRSIADVAADISKLYARLLDQHRRDELTPTLGPNGKPQQDIATPVSGA